jgi:hypothetical protein
LIYINTRIGFWESVGNSQRVEAQMKLSIAFAAALLITGFIAASTKEANAAVVYCQNVDYPAGCAVRAGVVL